MEGECAETRRSEGTAWLWNGVAVVLAVLFASLSLADVSGATRRADGTCCDTEYEHGWWSLAPTLLVIPIYLVARSSWRLTLLAVVISATSVSYIAYTGVTRIEDAGWGDGLEVLSYVEAALQTVLFVVAGLAGYAASRARRRGKVLA